LLLLLGKYQVMTAVRQSLSPKRSKSSKNSSSHSANSKWRSHSSSDSSKQFSSKSKQDAAKQLSFTKGNNSLINLKILRLIQQSSSLIAFVLVIATLIIYACSFYLPQQWSKEYKQLKILQRQERELIRVNESLKKQLAQQAENPDAGLENFDPTSAIFISPAQSSSTKTTINHKNTESQRIFDRVPVGY
jgi:hypothetical protein